MTNSFNKFIDKANETDGKMPSNKKDRMELRQYAINSYLEEVVWEWKIMVLFKGNKKYSNYNKLATNFSSLKNFDGSYDGDRKSLNMGKIQIIARNLIHKYNSDYMSWNRKIISAKVVAVGTYGEIIAEQKVKL